MRWVRGVTLRYRKPRVRGEAGVQAVGHSRGQLHPQLHQQGVDELHRRGGMGVHPALLGERHVGAVVVDGQLHPGKVLRGGFPQQALVRHVHCHHVVGRKVPQGDARKEILELLRHRVGAEEAHLFPQAHQAPQQGAGRAQGVPVRGGVAHHQNLVPASQQGSGLGAVQHGLFLLAGGGFVPGLFRLQVVEQLGDVGAVLDGIGGLKKQLGHMAQGEALPQLPADEPGGGL